MSVVEGTCLKCKVKRQMENATVHVLSNGAKQVRGTCNLCGCKMSAFLKKDAQVATQESKKKK